MCTIPFLPINRPNSLTFLGPLIFVHFLHPRREISLPQGSAVVCEACACGGGGRGDWRCDAGGESGAFGASGGFLRFLLFLLIFRSETVLVGLWDNRKIQIRGKL
jgi:hypothetical protein